MSTKNSTPNNRALWDIIIVIILLFSIAEVYVTHTYITSVNPGGNDFFSRWAGARALLI